MDTTASRWDITLNSGSVETTGKLFLLGLLTLHNGDGQEFLVDPGVQVKNVQDFRISTLLS